MMIFNFFLFPTLPHTNKRLDLKGHKTLCLICIYYHGKAVHEEIVVFHMRQ